MVEQGVNPAYADLLKKLYNQQTAAVRTDTLSRDFNIERGVKQGDPLSSLLFNCVSEGIMRKLQLKWRRSRRGVPLCTHDDRLTNLRFADDILLTTMSLSGITHMLEDLHTEAAAAGLQLHPDKTKIIHNDHSTTKSRRIPHHININDMSIEILPPSGSLKYLGRVLTFRDPHRAEIEHRITAAWRKFHSLKQELTSPNYSLNDRLRLFHGTVSATILYGSEAWTVTSEFENRIRKTTTDASHDFPLTTTTARSTTTPHGDHCPTTNADDNSHNDDTIISIDTTHTQTITRPPRTTERRFNQRRRRRKQHPRPQASPTES